MNNFKVRWFDKDSGEMIYSDNLPPEFYINSENNQIVLMAEGMDCEVTGLRYEPIESEPMFFSGLSDEKGADIYEGDIIKKPNGNWGVIVFKAPSFEVTVDEKQSSLYSLEYFKDVEVIGNINQTPELLTQ
jgi:hypothetical protein